MKDIKHIGQDFQLTARVMPKGWDLGVLLGVWGQVLSSQIQPGLVCELLTYKWHKQQHNCSGLPPPWALGRGQRSNIIKSQLLSQFQTL